MNIDVTNTTDFPNMPLWNYAMWHDKKIPANKINHAM